MTIQFKHGGATTCAATRGKTPSKMIGIRRETRVDEACSRRPKAKINVKRYSASGRSQRKGTDATFAAMWLVTASISPDGINDAAIQKSRVLASIVAAGFDACSMLAAQWRVSPEASRGRA